MWISLSPKLAEIDFTKNQDAVAAIEAIWGSFFRGEHIVFSDRTTLIHLRDAGLSLSSRSSINSVLARFAELQALEKQQLTRVLIDPCITQSSFSTPNTWNIPLIHFSTVALVPACLLGENLRDATAYLNCANHAIKIRGPKGIKVNLTKDSGGGADISNKLLELAENKRQFVLAITDTDKTHPSDAPCSPTKKCAEISAQSNWVILHHELNCSEIENIIPTNLISDSIENSPAAHELSHRLDFLRSNVFKNPDLHKWFDLKNGTKLSRIKSSNNNYKEHEHWKNASKNIASAFECDKKCTTSQECQKSNTKECQCVFLPGLGDDTLDRFNSYCSKTSLNKLCERINTSENSKDWLQLGALVASWGAALERKRS